MQVNIHAVLRVSPADGSPLSALQVLAMERGYGDFMVVDEAEGIVEITLSMVDVPV